MKHGQWLEKEEDFMIIKWSVVVFSTFSVLGVLKMGFIIVR